MLYMASHTLIPVTGLSLSQASFLGNLSRKFTNSSKQSSKVGLVQWKRTLCTAVLNDAETWRSTVQQYSSILLPFVVVPLLASNRALRVCMDCVCTRVGLCLSQVWSLPRGGAEGGLSTLLTVLILANAFYSDIAPPNKIDTFENVPQDLSEGDKPRRIQRPKSQKAEGCTQKCLGTCIRGGAGSPGEGPFNVRKPLVVFKDGFRSRKYCLIECSDICNLIGDGDSGP